MSYTCVPYCVGIPKYKCSIMVPNIDHILLRVYFSDGMTDFGYRGLNLSVQVLLALTIHTLPCMNIRTPTLSGIIVQALQIY